MHRLDVIVPCYGQHKLTSRLLSSFTRYAPKWARLILVDNARGVPEASRLKRGGRPRLVIRNSENLGFVRAVNMGLCASDAEYVCIQNNDTEIFEGCYERLIADLELNPDIAVMSPVASDKGSAWLSLDELQKRWPWYAQNAPESHEDRAKYLMHTTWPLTVHRPSMVPFFCAMMPRATIDRFGLLDTRYGIGLGDDDDYCYGIRQGGAECGLSLGTYVYHVGRATFDAEFTPEEVRAKGKESEAAFNAKWGTNW